MISVTSTAFINGGHIPDKYGCHGANVNPPLAIYGLPPKTASWVLIVTDRDAAGGHFVHWSLYNMDPAHTTISENSVPYGAKQGKNDFGNNNYGGPCPPYGTHHYHFKVYALGEKLELSSGASRSQIEQAMADVILGQGELVGTYAKK